MRFTINILFALISVATYAQEQKDLQKLDSLIKPRVSYMPTGVRLGFDAISPIRTFTDSRFLGYEVNADIDFSRYYLTLELGHWERDLKTDLEEYINGGNYFRVGVDVNFLKKDPEKNMFFIGGRYGHGKFSEELTITSEDDVWGSSTDTYRNTDVKANWFELTTGLKVRMFKFFWMGYTARYKFALNTDAPRGFIPHDVPGYGKTYKDNTWGFNYYLMFRIPLPSKERMIRKVIEKNLPVE